MSKRKLIKKFCSEKIIPNKRKIAVRVIQTGAIYMISGPALAVAIPINTTEVYKAVVDSCLGNKLKVGNHFFIPAPRSYKEGAFCIAALLACGVAGAEGFGNPVLDNACFAILRVLYDAD